MLSGAAVDDDSDGILADFDGPFGPGKRQIATNPSFLSRFHRCYLHDRHRIEEHQAYFSLQQNQFPPRTTDCSSAFTANLDDTLP